MARSKPVDWEKLLLWGGGALVLYLIFRPRTARASTLPAALPGLSEPRYFEIEGRGCVDSVTNSQVDDSICTLCEQATPGSFNWKNCYPEAK